MIDPTVKPNTIDEVVIKKEQVVSGTVNLPIGSKGLVFGTILTSIDAGVTWNSQERDLWVAGAFVGNDEVFHNGRAWKVLVDTSTEPVDEANII